MSLDYGPHVSYSYIVKFARGPNSLAALRTQVGNVKETGNSSRFSGKSTPAATGGAAARAPHEPAYLHIANTIAAEIGEGSLPPGRPASHGAAAAGPFWGQPRDGPPGDQSPARPGARHHHPRQGHVRAQPRPWRGRVPLARDHRACGRTTIPSTSASSRRGSSGSRDSRPKSSRYRWTTRVVLHASPHLAPGRPLGVPGGICGLRRAPPAGRVPAPGHIPWTECCWPSAGRACPADA